MGEIPIIGIGISHMYRHYEIKGSQEEGKKNREEKQLGNERLKKLEEKNKSRHQEMKNCKEEEHLCAFCQEFGRNNELWFCCGVCDHWVHAACSDADTPEGYICDNCR